MVKSFFLLSFLIAFQALGQEGFDILQKENEISLLLTKLRQAKDDSEKEATNSELKDSVKSMLSHAESFNHTFTKLRSLGVIDSPDKSFRLFTWNVEWDDLSHLYECLIVRYNERKKEFITIELTDNSIYQDERPSEILEQDDWYGALYYQIVPFEKGNKDLYLVMGWDGFTSMSNRKILDVLYFSGNNVKLGSPVFKSGNETQKRVFYEFAENATMALRWDEQYGRIIMDHLSPESPNLKGFYAYYVPDMSYDAFEMNKGKWFLKEDVIAVNKKTEEKINVLVQGPDGTPIEKKLKSKWEDPSDAGSPAGGNTHVADLPVGKDDKATKKTKKEAKAEEVEKKKREEKSNIYPLKEGKKKRKKN